MFETGQSFTLPFTFSQEKVAEFAQVSGDRNPIHLDAEFAATTPFERPIVHGMFACSLISAILGQHMPGPGTIYLEQNVRFLAPIFVGDSVDVCCTIDSLNERRRALINTSVVRQGGDNALLVDGKATVLLPRDQATA